jgi:hypothetical protein
MKSNKSVEEKEKKLGEYSPEVIQVSGRLPPMFPLLRPQRATTQALPLAAIHVKSNPQS